MQSGYYWTILLQLGVGRSYHLYDTYGAGSACLSKPDKIVLKCDMDA